MKNLDLMSRIGDFLRSAGLTAVEPAPDDTTANRTMEASLRSKRAASRRHMDLIRHPETAAVLVVNVDRPGAQHYVGPNAFAEIGVAFSDDRKVFLLQGMPEAYAEELGAWDVKCLNGEIQPLLEALAVPNQVSLSAWKEAVQRASA